MRALLPTLPDVFEVTAMVIDRNEGLATVFAEEYTGAYFDEAYSYPEDAATWLKEILALPVDADYSTWMMGEHPDGRNSTRMTLVAELGCITIVRRTWLD